MKKKYQKCLKQKNVPTYEDDLSFHIPPTIQDNISTEQFSEEDAERQLQPTLLNKYYKKNLPSKKTSLKKFFDQANTTENNLYTTQEDSFLFDNVQEVEQPDTHSHIEIQPTKTFPSKITIIDIRNVAFGIGIVVFTILINGQPNEPNTDLLSETNHKSANPDTKKPTKQETVEQEVEKQETVEQETVEQEIADGTKDTTQEQVDVSMEKNTKKPASKRRQGQKKNKHSTRKDYNCG